MNTTSKPVISILMAVYNSQEFLNEAIESVLNQNFQQWELICINDGSSDKSLSILEIFSKKDQRIIVVDQVHTGSASKARNAGLRISKGDFIAMLDSDDKIEPDYLIKLVERQQKTNADIIISSIDFWDYQKDTVTGKICGINGDVTQIISGREAFLLSLDWKIGGIGLCNAILLKKIGYDTTGMNGDEYTTRLLFLKATTVAFCNARYFYRNNLGSTTKKFSIKYFDVQNNRYRIFQLIKNNGFKEETVKFWKEDLIKSLITDYRMYSNKKSEFTKAEKLVVKNTLKANTNILYKEFLQHPTFDNKGKNAAYSVILLHSNIAFIFSMLWQTKKNLKTFFIKKEKA